MNNRGTKKTGTLFLVLFLFLVGLLHGVVAEQMPSISLLTENLEKTREIHSSATEIQEMEPILPGGWCQLVGDYPSGRLDNGFNNPYNSNIRGKATFTVDDTEYLFFGTGNINKTCHAAKKVTFPIIRALTLLAGISLKATATLCRDLITNNQQLLNMFVIDSMEGFFKKLSSEGCELWYYHDTLGWKQSIGTESEALITSGFNNRHNFELTVLTPFQPRDGPTYLYAGTWNPKEGCEVWRALDPIQGTWEPLIHSQGTGCRSSGFGNVNNTAAYTAAVLGDWLYIGTMNWENGCEIWRTDGYTWDQVIGGSEPLGNLPNGFTDHNLFFDRNIYAWEMCVYNTSQGEGLYVGTFNVAGCELWKTMDGAVWECLVGDQGKLKRGFSQINLPLRILNYGVRRMKVYNDDLYIGTASTPSFHIQINDVDLFSDWTDTQIGEILSPGLEIWKYDGTDFTKVVGKTIIEREGANLGFNDKTNAYCWSMEEYDGCLFVGTMNPGVYVINITEQWEGLIRCNITFQFTNDLCHFNGGGGCDIWYTDDGDHWYQMIGDEVKTLNHQLLGNGFDDHNNIGARALITYNDRLYVGVMNGVDGCEIWSFDGSSFPDREPVKRECITFESNGYTLYGEIYYPVSDEGPFPALVFCEGLPAYVSAYNWLAKALAAKGYVVIMFDPPGLGQSEGLFDGDTLSFPNVNLFFRFGSYAETPFQYVMRHWTVATSDALTYLLSQSSLTNLIDGDRIGLVGHSLGGITATETAARDKRFDAVVALSHGNPLFMRKITVPIQFICGGLDVALDSVPLSYSCYMKAKVPKEFILVRFGTHIGFTTAFEALCPCPDWQKETVVRYVTGWFDYFLKEKPEAYEIITSRTTYLSNFMPSKYNFGDEDHILT